MDDHEFDELNHRAFFALRGFSVHWARDVIRLLRSDQEISREVREELASALDGGTIDGTRLVMKGNRRGLDDAKGFAAQRHALAVIEWIEERIPAGSDTLDKDTLELAAGQKGFLGESSCERVWRELRPLYREQLAKLSGNTNLAQMDDEAKKALAMNFAYQLWTHDR